MTSEQRAIVKQLRQIGPHHSVVDDAIDAALGTCGNCKHADVENSPENYVYCTLRTCFYNGKTMQATARCERWEAQ